MSTGLVPWPTAGLFAWGTLERSGGQPLPVLKFEVNLLNRELQRMASENVPSPLPRGILLKIFLYLGCLVTLLSLFDPNGGLLDVPMSFILKNQLGMTARDVATFRLIASIPLYLSFLFGLCRDALSAERIRDREIICVFSLASAVLYVALATLPISYWTLIAASSLGTSSFLFVSSAQGGLTASFAQQRGLSGQISAVWNIFSFLPSAAAFVIGGYFSQFLEVQSPDRIARFLFLVEATLSIAVLAFSFLKPRSLFENVVPEQRSFRIPKPTLKELIRHPPVYPALAIWLLWNFSPGSITPLQYFLQNRLGATDVQWGIWNAIFTGSFIPAFVLYGVLALRVTFKTLLWAGTLLAIPQFAPLLFVNSLEQGLIYAAPIGLMGGIATAAYLDLIIRSCPRGLQGTMIMMSGGIYFLSTRVGDIVGTYLYDRFDSFESCVVMMISTYALIPLVLMVVPKDVLSDSAP
jgi:Major Facilitator Superfamily